ncbi:MAG: hypothetical protein PWQ88_938 [Candidatus Methanomethylophilaceae archaeon]|nr:hypothetical protein [Candidatus Methanomethylophilaceae archaeon]MDI3542146.1 hypothetical protein [Candidatus Methanomethylophilaceae archaeon]
MVIEMSGDACLEKAFQRAGREFGYNAVKAEFSPFRELKIRWQRSAGWAEFKVSDYLSDADEIIIEDLARVLFMRIAQGKRSKYPEELQEWMASPDFVKKKQPVYLRRSRNLSRDPRGKCYDLRNSYERLIETGMVERDPEVFLSWTLRPNLRRVGYCSVFMKVIAISCALDDKVIPEFVTEYVLYHELLHLADGPSMSGQVHDEEFRRREKMHPMWKEAEEWLRRLSVDI